MFCECGSQETKIELTPYCVHYGKAVCSKCNKFIRWVSSPDHEGERRKTSKYDLKQVSEHYKLRELFCFFCLRTKEELGIKETLTIDHIHELSKGGEDIMNNLQILCSACHKLKNWTRLYLNWHLKEAK